MFIVYALVILLVGGLLIPFYIVFDILVFKRTISNKGNKKKSKRVSSDSIATTILTNLDLLKPIYTYSLRTIRTFNVNRLMIIARLGFPNPATTGMLMGYYYAFSGALLVPLIEKNPVTVSIKADYHTEVFDYQTYIEFSNNLVKLLIPMIMFTFSKPIRSRIINKIFHR